MSGRFPFLPAWKPRVLHLRATLNRSSPPWGGGGGVRFTLPIQSRPVQLSIGARYQHSGDVEYMREGDLVDLPDGSYRKELQRGATDFVAFTIGGSVGFSFPRPSASDRPDVAAGPGCNYIVITYTDRSPSP